MAEFKKQIFSDHFVSRTADLLKDYVEPAKIDKFIFLLNEKAVQNYFSPSVEYNLLRLLETNYDRIGFVFDSFRYPHYSDILVSIAASSNFLTEIVVKNPEYLYLVLQPEKLKNELVSGALSKEIFSEVSKFNSFNSKLNILKALKRRYTLLIGMQDVLGIFPLKKITEHISVLAVSLLSELFNCCLQEISKRNSINIPKTKHCLIALGKLGGGELNYSSDVDLMLIYDINSKIGKNKSVEYYDFISQVIQLFSSTSTNINEKGFLFRIDFRLRPDGKNSPLGRTFSDTIKYYETRGEDWEKQMLIKASFVNGNSILYKKFQDYINPFIFSSSFSVSPLAQISKMKKSIERQFPDENNIKLCKGGIRDIEFMIQALQLINGNKFPEIRSGNSLDSINLLEEKKLLDKNEKTLLTQAYIFFRQIEHFLQLDDNQQTHSIPMEKESLTKLFSFLGFENETPFFNKTNSYKRDVSNLFDKITQNNNEDQSSQTKLTAIKFKDKRRAESNFIFLKKGISSIGQKTFDNKTITLFSNFELHLIDYLAESICPDRILENFAKVVRNLSFPSIFYSEFQNIGFLTLFLKLCEFSQRAIDMMSTDKELVDFFLTRKVFTKNHTEVFQNLSAKKFIFLLSAQLALKLITTEKLSSLLSQFLTEKITVVAAGQKINIEYFIGGLGSFGTKEMTFSSDVDLLFICENISSTYKIQKNFEELVTKINSEISPFKTDLRLRPEGNKGPLVWDISKIDEYFSGRARTWEFQSLSKLSFVCGKKTLFENFKNLIVENVGHLVPEKVLTDIKSMQTNIKQSRMMLNTFLDIKNDPGTLNDINFLIDSYILLEKKLYELSFGKRRSELLKTIYEDNPELVLESLYKLLKECEISSQNISNISNSKLPLEAEENILLNTYLDLPAEKEITDELKKLLDKSKLIIKEKL